MAAITRLPAPRLMGPRTALSSAAGHSAVREAGTFAAVGVASTAAYVVLYAILRAASPAAVANAVALLVTAVGNTAANRRLTFAVRGRDGLLRDHAAGLLALGVALAITSASLGLLDAVAPRAGARVELAVLVAANALATVARFLLLRVALHGGRSAGPDVTPRVVRSAGASAERTVR